MEEGDRGSPVAIAAYLRMLLRGGRGSLHTPSLYVFSRYYSLEESECVPIRGLRNLTWVLGPVPYFTQTQLDRQGGNNGPMPQKRVFGVRDN